MVDRPAPDPPPASPTRLRRALAALVFGVAVTALLVAVAVFVIARVDGPDDTPPNFPMPTVSVSVPAGTG